MFYDIDEIVEFVKTFHPTEDGFTEEDVDDFISSIDINKVPLFDYDTGATKLVIIPIERDYVIKIPFSGFYGDDDEYYSFEEEDYCSLETEIYEEAAANGFGDLFLPIKQVVMIAGYPIYVQPQAETLDVDDREQKRYSSKDSRDIVINEYRDGNLAMMMGRKFPLSWVASCLDVLEKYERLVEFFDYLEKNCIWDLHFNNIGYVEEHAVIIDYGGYNEP